MEHRPEPGEYEVISTESEVRPRARSSTSRFVVLIVALAVVAAAVMTGCSGAAPTSSPAPTATAMPSPSDDRCQFALMALGTYTKRIVEDYAALRAAVVAFPYVPGSVTSVANRISSTLFVYAALPELLGDCTAMVQLGSKWRSSRAPTFPT